MTVLALLALLLSSARVHAQASAAVVEVRLAESLPPGSLEPVIELRREGTPSQSWSARLHPGEPLLFRSLPPGRYRVISGDVEAQLEASPGDKWVVELDAAAARMTTRTDGSADGSSRRGYGTWFGNDALRMLPESGGVFGVIERSDPLVVTEHIEGGGAYPEMQRLAASGASWTQATYRLGEADITDPDRTGLPMMYPNLDAFEAVGVTTAGAPVDTYGAGTLVTLVPRRPAASWQRSVQVMASPAALQSVNAQPGAPSIARLASMGSGSFLISGPLSPRLGLFATANVGRSSRTERGGTPTLGSRTGSLATHLVFSATPRDELRLFAEHDSVGFPAAGRARLADPGLREDQRDTLLSTAWDHRPVRGFAWSAHATYAHSAADRPLSNIPVVGTLERLREGPAEALAADAAGTRSRTSLDWRADPGPSRWLGVRHTTQFGANASWIAARRDAPGSTLIGELVNGAPARVWQYSTTGTQSRWDGTELAFWVSTRVPVTPRFEIEAAVRASAASAGRRAAPVTISWRAVSPKIQGTWRALDDNRLTVMAAFSNYTARLPLQYLAFGDPNSLSGTVSPWDDRNGDRVAQASEAGPVTWVAGPCCAGALIDPRLSPPSTGELLVGVRVALRGGFVIGLTGTDRFQHRLIQPVNTTGLPAPDYVVTYMPDRGLNELDPVDDQLLPVFNGIPSARAGDYILRNVDHDTARDHGVDLVVQRPFDGRWGMLAGATAHKSDGIGASRGFGPNENDQGVLGEVFADPNAQTHARGRLFFERGYVIKWSALYQLPRGIRGAAAARYQDGQHFTRAVVVPDLLQGTEPISALPRGRTRFTFAFTLDTRLEKDLPIGGRRATAVLEFYNLLNTRNEVEEDVTSGPTFRTPTAVQPPRAIRVGVRVVF